MNNKEPGYVYILITPLTRGLEYCEHSRIIETIDYNDVAFEGGLLNCTTWIVRQ